MTVFFKNPVIPFETPVANFQPGTTVTVQGRPTSGGDRFKIQFKLNPGGNGDLAFHFCPRWITQPEVLGNSRTNSRWGREMFFSKGTSPFQIGVPFQIMFMVTTDGFKIAVNGVHFGSFEHRINLHHIKYMNFEGAVIIDQVTIYNQNPSLAAPSYGGSSHQMVSPSTFTNPIIPFETPLSNVQPGMSVTVSGHPTSGEDRFRIQFKCQTGPNGDLAFHFCPRWIKPGQPEVLVNTRANSKWGTEVFFSKGTSPFRIGEKFQIMFMITQEGFKVAVNGTHFGTFAHRLSLYNIKYLYIFSAIVVDRIDISQKALPYPPYYSQSQQGSGSAVHQPPPYESIVKPSQQTAMPVLNPMNDRPIAIPFPDIENHTINICGVPRQQSASMQRSLMRTRALPVTMNSMPTQFSVQLTNNHNPPDIFFFLNPRLGQQAIIRNSCYQSIWGAEESFLFSAFPFIRGQPFQLEITVDQQCFRVVVNGTHVCDFAHRQRPVSSITHIKFSGNVKVSSVTFC